MFRLVRIITSNNYSLLLQRVVFPYFPEKEKKIFLLLIILLFVSSAVEEVDLAKFGMMRLISVGRWVWRGIPKFESALGKTSEQEIAEKSPSFCDSAKTRESSSGSRVRQSLTSYAFILGFHKAYHMISYTSYIQHIIYLHSYSKKSDQRFSSIWKT